MINQEARTLQFFLDSRNSEQTGEALLCLGNEPGGEVVARLPYKTELDRIRARLFYLLPQAYDQISEFEQLWFYHGGLEFECPTCKTKSKIPGADDAQVGRITRLKLKIFA
jgi:hypothetical protein